MKSSMQTSLSISLSGLIQIRSLSIRKNKYLPHDRLPLSPEPINLWTRLYNISKPQQLPSLIQGPLLAFKVAVTSLKIKENRLIVLHYLPSKFQRQIIDLRSPILSLNKSWILIIKFHSTKYTNMCRLRYYTQTKQRKPMVIKTLHLTKCPVCNTILLIFLMKANLSAKDFSRS